MPPLWSAPAADGPVDAVLALPGSKSMTNRALVLAALAGEPSLLRRPLRSRDTLLMAGALRALGVSVDETGPAAWQVTPGELRGPATLDVGLAGTVMRFVPPVAALATGDVFFDGDPYARRRPMGPILAALRTLGAEVDGDALPFTVHGAGGVAGGSVTIDASASSQLVSGLLLAAPRYAKGVEVPLRLSIGVGALEITPEEADRMAETDAVERAGEELIACADRALYAAKGTGRAGGEHPSSWTGLQPAAGQ